MASLEYIDFKPWREVAAQNGFEWQQDKLAPTVHGMPQIFWREGDGWAEANHWALERIGRPGTHIETVKGLMKHLHAYARFLEAHDLDWRHFPIRLSDRAVVRFRGDLLKQVELGNLASPT